MRIEIVKRTELANGLVVMTTRRADAFCIRPFATFSLLPTSKFAQRLDDFVTESAALHRHSVLVKMSNGKKARRNKQESKR